MRLTVLLSKAVSDAETQATLEEMQREMSRRANDAEWSLFGGMFGAAALGWAILAALAAWQLSADRPVGQRRGMAALGFGIGVALTFGLSRLIYSGAMPVGFEGLAALGFLLLVPLLGIERGISAGLRLRWPARAWIPAASIALTMIAYVAAFFLGGQLALACRCIP